MRRTYLRFDLKGSYSTEGDFPIESRFGALSVCAEDADAATDWSSRFACCIDLEGEDGEEGCMIDLRASDILCPIVESGFDDITVFVPSS